MLECIEANKDSYKVMVPTIYLLGIFIFLMVGLIELTDKPKGYYNYRWRCLYFYGVLLWPFVLIGSILCLIYLCTIDQIIKRPVMIIELAKAPFCIATRLTKEIILSIYECGRAIVGAPEVQPTSRTGEESGIGEESGTGGEKTESDSTWGILMLKMAQQAYLREKGALTSGIHKAELIDDPRFRWRIIRNGSHHDIFWLHDVVFQITKHEFGIDVPDYILLAYLEDQTIL